MCGPHSGPAPTGVDLQRASFRRARALAPGAPHVVCMMLRQDGRFILVHLSRSLLGMSRRECMVCPGLVLVTPSACVHSSPW